MKKIFTTVMFILVAGLINLTAQVRIYSPELSLPVDGAINQAPNLLLDWNAVTGGTTGIIFYEIQLATDPGFANPVTFETEFVTAIEMSELNFGETYYWHVRAKDGGDVSDWSETWSFRVIRRIVTTKPLDASEQFTDVKLEWKALTGLTSFEYQIDTVFNWREIASNVTTGLTGVAVVDETHAWVAGAGGKILFYDGTSFSAQTSGTTKDLSSISFLDASNGWAVGKGGTIIYFNGTDWTTQTSGITSDLYGVFFLNASNGWAVGKSGVILHYDGGVWSTQFTAEKDLNSVYATDENHGWAVGKSGYVAFFDGSSWQAQTTGFTKEMLFVFFIDAGNGWAAGKGGFIGHYADGQWSEYKHTLTTKDLTSLYFTDANNGWIVGKSGTVLQYDGIEWFSQTSGNSADLAGIAFYGNTGFIAGASGYLSSYYDEAFTSPLAVIVPIQGNLTSANLIDLYFGTKYFWRIRAKHNLDVSEWSGAKSFSTKATVELDKPNDNETDQNLDVLLKWEAMTDRVNFQIEISEDAGFTSPIFLETENNQINAELLTFGQEYFWHVRAINIKDTSVWSVSRKFTTIGTVYLISPANEATDVKLSPILTWEALSGITDYRIEFAEENNFANSLIDVIIPSTSATYAVPIVLEELTQYFWRVKAINGLDSSSWSATWSFTTLPPVGIDEPSNTLNIEVYPNPAKDMVWVRLNESGIKTVIVNITDLLGKTLIEEDLKFEQGGKSKPIDVTGLNKGIYMLKLGDGSRITTQKLIINR